MNKERLLNVAKALRESPKPEEFCMNSYGSDCGTPACALGHYAAREDLQDAFVFDKEADPFACVHAIGGPRAISHSNPLVREHFDLSPRQISQVFGCRYEAADFAFNEGDCLALCAETANEAADWIERFVAKS